MIVCVCHGVCERRLEAVVAGGAHTLAEVERQCGAGGDCGTCRPEVESVIERLTLTAPRHPAQRRTASGVGLPAVASTPDI
jgi:assimilatory nitrate reductase catalytic subunit